MPPESSVLSETDGNPKINPWPNLQKNPNPNHAQCPSSWPSMTIPAVLRIIESQLSRHDFVVKTAASGEEALRMLTRVTPAVLILE